MKKRILTVSSANMDLVLNVNRVPGAGETVTVVQFLKGTDANYSILEQIDEIRFFTFENSEKPYGELSYEEQIKDDD